MQSTTNAAVTYEGLYAIAERGGIVRWSYSGRIEKLWIGRKEYPPVVCARRFMTEKEGEFIEDRGHPIHPSPGRLYRCVELRADEPVSVGELLE